MNDGGTKRDENDGKICLNEQYSQSKMYYCFKYYNNINYRAKLLSPVGEKEDNRTTHQSCFTQYNKTA